MLALLLVSCTREPLPGFRERGKFLQQETGKDGYHKCYYATGHPRGIQ